jgi:hypothetical protein
MRGNNRDFLAYTEKKYTTSIHIFIFSDTLKSFESFYRTLAFNPPLAKIEVEQNQ